ncbi:TonB-dependent receptor [Tenacibaculum sp. Bg11-29]|uniref:carboxypeptidase-like regulatory domain-containing protein n=1 Tax=Tenacibaculum sp. Bg11-29 TaxID=2058306 RepID=UPI000C33F4B2|nr:carboxypeptidase-like regulatory domain-containing protein [Tenacibaculum sp. Bg11-29]PKH49694.1 TonB-dependent receptor [Tenacibaculum sp. Bg11-29]
MRIFTVTILLTCLSFLNLSAQNAIKGIVINSDSDKPLQGVLISVKEINFTSLTNFNGAFTLNNLPKRELVIIISLKGFKTQNIPIQITEGLVDLGIISIYKDASNDIDLSTITLTDDELNDDSSIADNITGLLQSSKDTYLRAATYEWSASFYSIKGLGSENAKVLINGIEMNKHYNGRPQWSNWGGLNSVLRNQDFSSGLSPSSYSFGGVLGVTNINTRASYYKKSASISYASSNRSYSHRLMAKYSSGLLKNSWAFTVSASKRHANEGFTEGTSYNAYSIFASLEKQINKKHSLNFTAIQAKNSRGKSAANTQEVFNLKGTAYNPYWGYQNGKIRNARIKRINEPIFMLNHYWKLNNKTSLNTGIAYQFGETGNSRIDFNGGNDPSPTYYRKLPNYFLNNSYGSDHANAYKSFVNFKNDGQLNWLDLYIGNKNTNNNALFALYEDRNDAKLITVTTNLNAELTDNITLSGNLKYKKINSENFANVLDLFGASGYLDINKFGDIGNDNLQNDLLNPNRVVKKGDKFKYNYKLMSQVYGGFTQLQFKYNKIDFYIASAINNTSHQREGLYKNGIYPGSSTNATIPNSFGKSKKINHFGYGVKTGFTYKISGRHLLDFNGGYISKVPSIRNSFVNSRFNNLTVAEVSSLNNEKITSLDASYIVRTPFITAKLSGYYTTIKDATNIAFYFTGADNLFVQEITTGINKKHFGTEIGIEAQVLSSFKLKAAANIGQYTYSNNPTVTLASEISTKSSNAGFNDSGIKDYGRANLKNYRIASGPQTAYSFGFEYRDPNYWFIGMTLNYLDNIYVSPSIIKRTTSFVSDDSQFFPNFNPALARKLLSQEKFDAYFTLNAIGGKTWNIGKGKYIGFFASLNNILNEKYKTGGYEQGRTANYKLESKDKVNGTPNFGTKYWYGRGATYFLNINYRF